MKDYEVLRKELPNDNDVAESLFHAQVALRKSRGEEVHNMKFGGEVEFVSGLEQFRAAISSPGKYCCPRVLEIEFFNLVVLKISVEHCRCICGSFQIGSRRAMQTDITISGQPMHPISVH